jgi:hypothetical protein
MQQQLAELRAAWHARDSAWLMGSLGVGARRAAFSAASE